MKPILLLCLLAFAACNSPKPKSDITDIELISSGIGSSILTEIKIDSSLNYHFYGGWVTDKTNKFHNGPNDGKISRDLWDTLMVRVQQIDDEKLKKIPEGVADEQDLVIVIHHKDKIEHIKAEDLPSDVSNIFYDIANSYTTGKLRYVK